MRNDDFAIFILSHARPDKVLTYETLMRTGYSGKVYIIIDNEDETAQDYYARYGEKVIMFDKSAVAETVDQADNSTDRRAVLYARNACFDIAEQLGITYFLELDDDYNRFEYKIDGDYQYPTGHFLVRSRIDDVFDWMLDYYRSIDAVSIALAQTGDFIGGKENESMYVGKRKCMNSFFCSTKRRFQFVGRFNDDVNTYVWYQSLGNLFLTVPFVAIGQLRTQANKGGMTEVYKDSGTYVKSFYPVMFAPSCVKVGLLNTAHSRLHHQIDWKCAVPCIIPERFRKSKSANE